MTDADEAPDFFEEEEPLADLLAYFESTETEVHLTATPPDQPETLGVGWCAPSP